MEQTFATQMCLIPSSLTEHHTCQHLGNKIRETHVRVPGGGGGGGGGTSRTIAGKVGHQVKFAVSDCLYSAQWVCTFRA